MKIFLDTNVVSELVKIDADPAVIRWLDARPASDYYLAAISAAELLRGVERLPAGKRRTQLGAAIAGMLEEDFAGRIVPFTVESAIEYSAIAGARERAGTPISLGDALIAATARAEGAAILATRNVADFQHCGLDIVNPWDAR